MQRYIDAPSILAEAQMMWKDYREAYIFIEGESDRVFFNTLFSPNKKTRFRSVSGWENVHKIVLLAVENNCSHVAGIIDRDYHDLTEDGISENTQLFFTDGNDIEMMLFTSNAFDKFLSVCADQNKLKLHDDYRKPILTAASYLGALRVISLRNQYALDFDGFECKNYVNRNTLVADTRQLTSIITQRTRSKGKPVTVTNEALQNDIERLTREYDMPVLCNGHDVLDIMGLSMSKLYSSASAQQYTSESLFDYLLMGYSTEEFQCSNLYKRLTDWMSAITNSK